MALLGMQFEPSIKLSCITTGTADSRTVKFTFTRAARDVNAFVFGRFGWDSAKLSCAIIHHPSANSAIVKNLGDEAISVSCTGDVVTITTAGTYAGFTIASADEISLVN